MLKPWREGAHHLGAGRAWAASPCPDPAGGDRRQSSLVPSLLEGYKIFLQKFPAAERVNPALGHVQIHAACPSLPSWWRWGPGKPGWRRLGMGHRAGSQQGGWAPNAGYKSSGAGGTCWGGGSHFGGRTMLAQEQMGKVFRNRLSLGTRRSLAIRAGGPRSPLWHNGSGAG